MKISEMTNDQAADAMIKMAQPMANLLNEEGMKALLEDIQNSDKENGVSFFAGILPKIVAFAMRDHKADVFAIVAALTQKPVSAVGKMNFMQTVKELKESIDEDFIGFFRQSGNATKAPGN